MDPNETLRVLRARASLILKAIDGGVDMPPDVQELAEAVENLDTWLRRGGALPADWNAKAKVSSKLREPATCPDCGKGLATGLALKAHKGSRPCRAEANTQKALARNMVRADVKALWGNLPWEWAEDLCEKAGIAEQIEDTFNPGGPVKGRLTQATLIAHTWVPRWAVTVLRQSDGMESWDRVELLKAHKEEINAIPEGERGLWEQAQSLEGRKCEQCRGTGRLKSAKEGLCYVCKGTGFVEG